VPPSEDDLGELIVGAKPLAAAIYKNARKWRSVLSPTLRADLGLFLMGNRLCGYSNVIQRRIAAKLEAATPKPKAPRRRASRTHAAEAATA
jgi:hypothetical protein